MKYLNAFVAGIILSFCLFTQACNHQKIIIKTNEFSSIEQRTLGIKEVKFIYNINGLNCYVYISNSFPIYNRETIEDYIETKLNNNCDFYYE
jgi:hypothetical protein